ncbi:DNA topoisomerase 3-alpha [Cyclospora cayetanensis]|uniref:DNA topoisomerase n=1 Tax=Cyclospora cayetanensis TaxID=88456 RepID=A0A6P6RTV3_9EIME|nr:DNA topoisomerase 3-alpha [Cyclospora cayetanensis]
MTLDFSSPFSSWNAVPPEALFSAPVSKRVSDSAKDIVGNLKTYAKKCQWLVLWLDCDREGENIAFEAADARSEIDLRIGTPLKACSSKLSLQRGLIRACYVSPRRFLEVEQFVSEKFWAIKTVVEREDDENPGRRLVVDFQWDRQRLFDRYPRTETERFTRSQDLLGLIENQRDSPLWGPFAVELLEGGFEWPRDGPHDDMLSCACCCITLRSSDAIGFETKVQMDIAGEAFSTTGLIVLQKNYLSVYPYDSWVSRRLPRFLLHERFLPKDVTLHEGSTQPPSLLSEADLIDKMDKERNYAIKTELQQFKPTDLGVALVMGYKVVGRLCKADLSKPDLRASMERDMTKIARGLERKDEVVQRHVGTVAEVFHLLRLHIALLDEQIQKILPPLAASDADARVIESDFCTCAKCGASMNLMACTNQATCELVLRMPRRGTLTLTQHTCPYCCFKVGSVGATASWFHLLLRDLFADRTLIAIHGSLVEGLKECFLTKLEYPDQGPLPLRLHVCFPSIGHQYKERADRKMALRVSILLFKASSEL